MGNRKSALSEGLQSINRGGGFKGLIQPTEKATASAPSAEPKQQSVAVTGKKRGRKPNPDSSSYSRMCAVVNIELQAKLQEIAHRNSLSFKEVLEQAMEKAVEAYETKYGEIELPQGQDRELF